VTDPLARIPRSAFKHSVPRTAVEFAQFFLESPDARANRNDMESYRQQFVENQERAEAFKASAQAERSPRMRKGSPYTISLVMQTRAVLLRRVQILEGGWLLVGLNLSLVSVWLNSCTLTHDHAHRLFIIFGIIMGTIYYQSPEATSAFYSRGGILFL